MTTSSIPKMSRRRLMMAGAGTAGALAAAAALPVVREEVRAPAPQPKDASDQGGGYQVTEHVLRYYKSARV